MVASASAAERYHVDVPEDGMDAEVLFRRYARNVSALLYRLGVPPQDLHDLTQEVFLVAHRKGGYLPGPAQPMTWLARIAFGIASDYRRVTRRRLQRMAAADEGLEAGYPAPQETKLAADESRSLVFRALQALDPEKRIVFVLFEIEGESCASIAAGLGIPKGTVFSRLRTAREEFRRAIGLHSPEQGK